ncbi:hypothetical protein ACIGO8_21800 [Streptomyces sp. NPDC053493]|uniref:hypothetical protein n=1 Tax=Streptomyces sp. NPDC053493 TaxID=3365705 RepID=UPI0037CF7ED4
MLTFKDVLDARLGKLQAAAQDWGAMVTKLEQLAETARTGMKARAARADWRGVDAEVTRAFVDKTAKEFDDAAKEAKGIHQALADGHDSLKQTWTALHTTVEEAPAAGFLVGADGKVRPKPIEDARARAAARNDPDYQRTLHEHQGQWQRRIDELVDSFNDTDQSLARTLRANVGEGRDFRAPAYGSLKAEQADHAAALARKGRKLTHDELTELNDLLADHAKDPVFTTAFYDKLGAKGSLEFFGTMATDTEDWGRTDPQRLRDVQDLQRNLGLSLATATDPDHARHLPPSFAQDLRRLGTERIPLYPGDTHAPFGYQLLAGIMRNGSYDKRFLVPVAEHAAQIQAKDPAFFQQSKLGNGPRNPFNPSGLNGSGYDPTVGFLEALGHSPDAAKEFFDPDRTPQAYHRDGTAKSGPADLGKGADGKPLSSYLDLFTSGKFEVLPDTTSTDPAVLDTTKTYLPDALGHALEAATLGHAWDDPSPKLHRDDTSADIMEKVVSAYSDPALLKQQQSLSDSVGRMTAGYIDDIDRALGPRDGNPFVPKDGTGHATFDELGARQLLSALGRHPDAYATVSVAQGVYTTSVLEAQVGPDGRIDTPAARTAARIGAEVQGTLDQSRADQIASDGSARKEEYEKAVDARWGAIGTGADAVITAGSALIPGSGVVVPTAVDVGSEVLGSLAGSVMSDVADAEKKENADAVDKQTHADTTSTYWKGRSMARGPVEDFLARHQVGAHDPGFAEDLRTTVESGYNNGSVMEDQVGLPPRSDD